MSFDKSEYPIEFPENYRFPPYEPDDFAYQELIEWSIDIDTTDYGDEHQNYVMRLLARSDYEEELHEGGHYFRDHFMQFRLTTEQQAAVAAALRCSRVKIEALAGTGKTATLVEIARALKRETPNCRILYTAFNRKIVDAVASSMGTLAECSTMHKLAYHSVGAEFCKQKLRSSPFNPNRTIGARRLGIDECLRFSGRVLHNPFPGKYEEYPVTLTTEMIFEFASQTVNQFCKSADLEMSLHHVPNEVFCTCESFSALLTEKPFSAVFEIRDEERKVILEAARKLWVKIQSPDNFQFGFTHNHYLKMWHLSGEPLPYDVVLFDEAQDADPIMADVVGRHQGKIVWCGDRYQAIYEWRGAVNAMELVDTEATIYLTRSFRFGTEIAAVINALLEHLGAPELQGDPAIKSRVGFIENPDAEIFRSNIEALLRFVELTENGILVRVHFDVDELSRLASSIEDLLNSRKPSHQMLGGFDSVDALLSWLMNQPSTDDFVQTVWRLLKLEDRATAGGGQGGEIVKVHHGNTLSWLLRIQKAIRVAKSRRGRNDGRFVGTIHSVKGLEFESVFVGPQTLKFHTEQSRWHLAYVALSRARIQLHYQVEIFDQRGLEFDLHDLVVHHAIGTQVEIAVEAAPTKPFVPKID